jgi:hypothetical protein
MKGLAPFWRYYGGKNRAARLYPAPEHDLIIEPFAGAAGYSCRYYWKKVVLVDRSPIIAGMWRYLINVSEREILSIPDIPAGGTVDDLPSWIPQEGKWIAGFWCNTAGIRPGRSPSARAREYGQDHAHWSGWGWRSRRRLASQVSKIRHWQIIEGDYRNSPDKCATWHIDPPYANNAGQRYPHQPDSFEDLGDWCRTRKGLVMVCENAGADWLPFRHLASIKSQEGRFGKARSHEVIWTNRLPKLTDGGQRVFPWGAA